MERSQDLNTLLYPGSTPVPRQQLEQQNRYLPVNISFRKNNASNAGCELHWHEALEFYYVKAGAVLLLCNGEKQWIRPGQAGFVNWCEPHRGSAFLDGTEHYIIQIHPDFFSGEYVSLPGEDRQYPVLSLLASQSRNFPVLLDTSAGIAPVLDSLIESLQTRGPGYEFEAKSALYGILSCLMRVFDSTSCPPHGSRDLPSLEHLKKVLVFLSEHCTSPEEVTLPALSARFGLSVPYLCRIFKRHTNLTLTAYVNELRCSRAASLIRRGIPLKEAACLTGFRDYNYFSRLFKKVTGCAPSRYNPASPEISHRKEELLWQTK